MKKFYRKQGGYSKTLKMIYLNWCKKNNYSYVTGHVKSGISRQFSNNTNYKTLIKLLNCTVLPY